MAIAAVPLTTVALSLFAMALVLPSQTWANDDDEISTFTVDVSLTPVFKQNDVDPSEGQNAVSPGDTFFQEGTIYLAGTIQRGKPNNDPNAPGGIGKYYRVEFLPKALRILKRRPTVSRVRGPMKVS